jgi:Protein of unknown function (DUF3830)
MGVRIEAGKFVFRGRFEAGAPISCSWLRERLPLEGRLTQARWSGEAAWFPLGIELRLELENSTSTPKPGQMLLYGGSASEPEILFPYGFCKFAWKGGTLAGNHVITLVEGLNDLGALGEAVQLHGAQAFRIDFDEAMS